MTNSVLRLTDNDFKRLIAGRGTTAVNHEKAMLLVDFKGTQFEMHGPSGIHTLQIVATDLDRLNAHWVNFAADARNQQGARA